MLAQERVAFVLVECGFFYDQQLDWSGPRKLQYANVCFCVRTVAASIRG